MSLLGHFLKSCYVRKSRLLGVFIRRSGYPGAMISDTQRVAHSHCVASSPEANVPDPKRHHHLLASPEATHKHSMFSPDCAEIYTPYYYFNYRDPELFEKINKLKEGIVFCVEDDYWRPVSSTHCHYGSEWPLYTTWAVDEDKIELQDCIGLLKAERSAKG